MITLIFILFIPLENIQSLLLLLAFCLQHLTISSNFLQFICFNDIITPRKMLNTIGYVQLQAFKQFNCNIKSLLNRNTFFEVKIAYLIFWINNVDAIFHLNFQQFHYQLCLLCEHLFCLLYRRSDSHFVVRGFASF